MGQILVGVDGSPDSQRALQWAVDEAAIRGVSVDVIHAYKTEYIYYLDIPSTVVIPRHDIESAAQLAVGKVVDSIDNPTEVQISVEMVNSGNPAGEIAERSEKYDMVVLGSRGLGGLSGLLLGSVSAKVSHHSKCPVVIVPHEDE